MPTNFKDCPRDLLIIITSSYTEQDLQPFKCKSLVWWVDGAAWNKYSYSFCTSWKYCSLNNNAPGDLSLKSCGSTKSWWIQKLCNIISAPTCNVRKWTDVPGDSLFWGVVHCLICAYHCIDWTPHRRFYHPQHNLSHKQPIFEKVLPYLRS